MDRRLLLGLVLPALLVFAVLLFVPATAGQWLGISLRAWALFLCAPATSLALFACLKLRGAGPW